MSDSPATVEAAQPVVEVPAVAVEEKEANIATEKAAEETREKADVKAEEAAAEKNDAEAAPETTAEKESSEIIKTTAKIDHSKNANNSKFDPSVLPESEDHAAIQTQVHFYFSDSNLPTDKYMWELTGGPENKPVELKKLCSFGRMRRFKSYDTVVEALRKSKFLTVTGEAGAELLTRKTAYNPDRPRSKIDAATVYVKGFGDEEASTQFDLEAFFAQFGAINCVRLRRTAENLFKGSVFVEFEDAQQAAAFLAKNDPAPQWKGHDLKIMAKTAYVAEKSELIREGKIEPSNNSAPRFYEGRVVGGRRGGRGGHFHKNGSADKDDWKKRRDEDRKRGFRGGRGGRGRGGFGGRGRGGRGNHQHNNNRNGDGAGKPSIQATNDKGEPVTEKAAEAPAATNGKRSRDDDAAATEPPAKKVDTKADATA